VSEMAEFDVRQVRAAKVSQNGRAVDLATTGLWAELRTVRFASQDPATFPPSLEDAVYRLSITHKLPVPRPEICC
jgi:hypothetical protein